VGRWASASPGDAARARTGESGDEHAARRRPTIGREGLRDRRLAEQAANRAVEPWTRYLAHFIAAFSYEYQRRYQDAVREYAAALEAVPHAQSASIALAQLLLRDNQADAAFDLVNRSLTERPDGDDPWRLFGYGGYIRWPVLIADVRKAIR